MALDYACLSNLEAEGTMNPAGKCSQRCCSWRRASRCCSALWNKSAS